jgi:lysine 6-dehydrogenase
MLMSRSPVNVLIIGAGRIAYAIAYDLVRRRNVKIITIANRSEKAAILIKKKLSSSKIRTIAISAESIFSSINIMRSHNIAISCVPYKYNFTLAKAALEAGINFIDLGGNNKVVQKELSLNQRAKKARILIVPDCGLAPGLVSVLTKLLVDELSEIQEVHIRVGGLPLNPKPPLRYNQLFSIEGLVNEYLEPALILTKGKLKSVPSLSALELIHFDPPFSKMEAFSTSGGTSTLVKTYKKLKELDYKTIRYPGHLSEIKKLDQSKKGLLTALHKRLKTTQRDVVLLRVVGCNKSKSITYEIIDYYDPISGLTAMQRMTAYPTSILALLIGNKKIKAKGALTLEMFIDAPLILKQLRQRGINIQKKVTKI